MAPADRGRLFVSGFCEEVRCGKPFILVSLKGEDHPVRYCTPGCLKRARKQRKRNHVPALRSCPTEGCPHLKAHADHLVCAMCWMLAVSMCRGKRRLDAASALSVGRRCNRSDYGCPFCPGFHNGTPVDNPEEILQWGFRVARAIRARLGDQASRQLFDSWAPHVRSRAEWKQVSTTRREGR